MKIKSGFLLHTMGNENVVVAVEERTKEFRGMIRLNGTGAFIWEKLQEECSAEGLAEAMIEKYGITKEVADDAVATFTKKLSDAGVLEQ